MTHLNPPSTNLPEVPAARAPRGALAALRQFARDRAPPQPKCELCSAPLASEHAHLVHIAQRRLVCACEACAILFSGQADGAALRRVPRDVRRLEGFELSDAQWDRLAIPIEVAFFYYSTPDGRIVAIYPSPAGPVQSLLPLDAWSEIVADHPHAAGLQPDVEALLVNRLGQNGGGAGAEYYLAPLDECYALVGVIRSQWKGISGGDEVWPAIGQFFDNLRQRAQVP